VTAERKRWLQQVRTICLPFPEVSERMSHGTPTFFVRDKRPFVNAWIDGHHDHAFPHLWCAAPDGAQALLIESTPATYFRPPYVGHRGWVGVRLDGTVDWVEIREVCEDAYRSVAPRSLIAHLDSRQP
jgi:hypothetical protein